MVGHRKPRVDSDIEICKLAGTHPHARGAPDLVIPTPLRPVVATDGLLSALDITATGDGRFRASHADPEERVVFGGQLVAQMIVAAARCVPDLDALSISTVFARGVDAREAADIAVEVTARSTTFATCQVSISQAKRCADALVLMHRPDPDLLRAQSSMPTVVGPEELNASPTAPAGWDYRIVDATGLYEPGEVGPPELQVWSRFDVPSRIVPPTHHALIAYATDGFLIGAALRPRPDLSMSDTHVTISTTVLAHSISFHAAPEASQWHLLDQRSDSAGRGRAHGSGTVFSRDGQLLATFSQDSLIRAFRAGRTPRAGQRAKY